MIRELTKTANTLHLRRKETQTPKWCHFWPTLYMRRSITITNSVIPICYYYCLPNFIQNIDQTTVKMLRLSRFEHTQIAILKKYYHNTIIIPRIWIVIPISKSFKITPRWVIKIPSRSPYTHWSVKTNRLHVVFKHLSFVSTAGNMAKI